jgi:hypothetical protein
MAKRNSQVNAPQEVLNPQTGRFVKVGAQRHRRLVRMGILSAEVTEVGGIDESVFDTERSGVERSDELPPEPPKLVRSRAIPPVKKRLVHAATDVIKEQRHQFEAELTQKQTDELLKKLLYEKLCVSKPRKKKGGKGKLSRSHGSRNVKMRTPPSSESESSESE